MDPNKPLSQMAPPAPPDAAYPPQPPAYPPAPAPASYPPQPPGYTPVQPAYNPPAYSAGYSGNTSTTVVVTAPVGVYHHGSGFYYKQYPARIMCQYCSAQVTTMTTFESGWFPWAACAVIFLVGCWMGCCLIPFFISSFKDVIHRCPRCSNVVGKHTAP